MSTEPEKPSRTFLTKLYARLKELAGDKVSQEDFDSAVHHARAYAGGKAKAARQQAAESLNAFISRINTALFEWFKPAYSDRSPFSWAQDVFADHVIACSNDDGKSYRIPFSQENDQILFGEPEEVEAVYVPVGMNEVADICSEGHGVRLFMEQGFAEPPEWINYLPKPGKYNSPRYGEILITQERNENFVNNFKNKVYQESLPIDAEHDLAASGAVGWITDMKVNDDGSVDAKPEWNERGKELIKGDRFKYFSPAWYSVWRDPVDPEKTITDVAIGGALTTLPFFKEKALRPLVASERGLEEAQDVPQNVNDQSVVVIHMTALAPVTDTSKGDTTMAEIDPQQFAEVQTQLTEAQSKVEAAEAKNAALEAQLVESNEQVAKATERIAALEKDARAKKFSELAKNWIGDTDKHVAMLEHFSQLETDDLFKSYVETQNAAAVQVQTGQLFSEVGSGVPAEGSAHSELQAKVRARLDADPKMTEEQAFAEEWERAPMALKQRFRDEDRRTVN